MLKKINYVMNTKQKVNLLILFIMIFIGSAIELLSVAGVAPIVTLITDENAINENEIYLLMGRLLGLSDVRQYVLALSLGLMFVYIIKNLYLIFQNQLQYRYTYNNQRSTAMVLFDFYLKKEYLYHTNTNVSEITRNVEIDAARFWDTVLYLMQLSMETIVCAVLVIYLIISDWKSTISILFVMVCFVGLFSIFFRRYSTRLGKECRYWRANMTKHLLQAFSGIKEVKISGTESFFEEKYDYAFGQYCKNQRKQSVATILPKPIMESICICGLLLVISVRIFQGADMKMFVPILSVFVVAAYRMLPSFNRITVNYGNIMFGKASVENVYNDFREMNSAEHNITEKSSCKTVYDKDKDIQVEHLSFSYPSNEMRILSDVSITIPRKHSVAFIGSSGAGKSTLADLLLGLLEPQVGKICIDGKNIYDDLKSWHKQIGYIPQTIYLLDDTIRANIAFGLEEKDIDDDEIWRALRSAQLEAFVRGLPDGLDASVGERGVRISGGQRQRLGIARALYANPEVLVLDEATSALDNETEEAVMEAIDKLHGSHTMIIIAHRLTTIQNCDFIYEVKNGKLYLRDKEEVIPS